jgi:hypothetical protein
MPRTKFNQFKHSGICDEKTKYYRVDVEAVMLIKEQAEEDILRLLQTAMEVEFNANPLALSFIHYVEYWREYARFRKPKSIPKRREQMNDRITLDKTIIDNLTAMAEGNPGAITVLMRMYTEGTAIDPDSLLGSLGAIMLLDTFRVYGHRIWMLYKDVCGEDITHTIAVLRACQMGIIPQSQVDTAIDNRGQGIDVEEVFKLLKEQLPAFGLVEVS